MNSQNTYISLQTSSDVLQSMYRGNSNLILVKHYQSYMNRLILKEGKTKACTVLKSYYQIAVKTAMRQSFKPVSFRKSNKRGFPSDISVFEKFLLSYNYEDKRMALTILKSYVAINLKPDTDVSSITEVNKNTEGLSWLDSWEKYLTNQNWLCNNSRPCHHWTKQKGFRSTVKKGPNGPALMTSHLDAVSIVSCQDLWNSFKEYNLLMNQVTLNEFVQKLYDSKDDLQGSYNHSKLSYLSEGGGKTRVVAIGDYWTQEALKGLHDLLHYLLSTIPNDGTYDQNIVSRITRENTLKGLPTFCFDLKAATDRFPVKFIGTVISRLIGVTASNAWAQLISNRQFSSSMSSKTISYSVGTPMGLLTSWGSFALTHHLLIRYCAWKVNKINFSAYVLLGDDVVIFDEEVAVQYEKHINELGVSISQDKSMISYGPPFSGAEIAKRLFLNGKEISPIPYDVMMAARKDYTIFPMLVRTLHQRGVNATVKQTGALMLKWFGFKKNLPTTTFLPLLTIPAGLPGSIEWNMDDQDNRKPRPVTHRGVTVTLDNFWSQYDIEVIRQVLRKTRLKALSEKSERMFQFISRLSKGKGLIELFHSRGIPTPTRYKTIRNKDIPIRYWLPLSEVVQREFEQLLTVSIRLNKPGAEQDISTTEYIPNPLMSKFLGTHEKERTKYTSSIMMDTLRHLENPDPTE